MLPESKIGVGLQLFGEPLPQGLALQRGPAGDLHCLDAPRLASPLEPAFDGRAGDPEEVLDLLSRYAAVYCGERLQSEVPRISVHGGHSRAGSLLMQTAVRSSRLMSQGVIIQVSYQVRLNSLGYHATSGHQW